MVLTDEQRTALVASLTYEEKLQLRLIRSADDGVEHYDTIPARVLVTRNLAHSSWSDAKKCHLLTITQLGREVSAAIGSLVPPNEVPPLSDAIRELSEQMGAIERLLRIAKSDTGQSRKVADFLLAWWNASRDGGFDLTHLWNVDQAIADDMIAVFTFVANNRHYPDAVGLGAEFEQIVTLWRAPRRRKAVR